MGQSCASCYELPNKCGTVTNTQWTYRVEIDAVLQLLDDFGLVLCPNSFRVVTSDVCLTSSDHLICDLHKQRCHTEIKKKKSDTCLTSSDHLIRYLHTERRRTIR